METPSEGCVPAAAVPRGATAVGGAPLVCGLSVVKATGIVLSLYSSRAACRRINHALKGQTGRLSGCNICQGGGICSVRSRGGSGRWELRGRDGGGGQAGHTRVGQRVWLVYV